jgi:hypothetical protein
MARLAAAGSRGQPLCELDQAVGGGDKSLRRGRALCVALQRKPGGNRNEQSSDVSRYAASDCSELAKTDRVAVIVLGALDLDTRTLHMIIN